MPKRNRNKDGDDLPYALAVARRTLEATADGLVAVDDQDRIVSWNTKFLEMWGIPPDLIATRDAKRVRALISARLKDSANYLTRINEITGTTAKSFDLLELSDGKIIERYSEQISFDGSVVGRVWSYREVTDRYQADLISVRLAAIVDNSDDAIVGKDLNSIITSWNQGAERIFGYTADEMIGTSIKRIIPPERQGEEDEILARLRRGERYDHFETVRVTKDGRRLDVSLTISPIRDASGKIIGASKIARDISDRKRTEAALREAQQIAEAVNAERGKLLESERAARTAAERASRTKDEFLATLSHELRTPLNAILGWATTLRTGGFRDQELVQGLEAIERNARVQGQIVDDLLDMSRIISGKVRLEVQRVDLPAVVAAAIETVRVSADAKGIRLQTVIDPLNVTISGDPNRLQQIFWNLLSNAIKFTPKAGRVQILLERVDSHVEVSVIDTGEGVSPDFLPSLFDRFRQADASPSRRHGGLGLGLSIVKHLVELHGGTVRAKSGGLGKGATFVVSLPLAVLHPPEDTQKRAHPQANVGDLPVLPVVFLQNVHVLVVDDEPDARSLLKVLLETAGAAVHLAHSADAALEFLLAHSVDILICDIGLPEVDGYTLIRRIRRLDNPDKSEVAAIALTAYARLEDRTEAIRAGFQNHLPKPVEPAELLTVVQSLTQPRSKQPADGPRESDV
ncbi:MAG: PAS domain S-box protein [Verrucomicrobia bacterium]|nr:PAS domain S-box protein [Verrucomicrobiota bacterium]